MNRGQIFSLDLVVSLIIVVLVISLSTVLIDRDINQMYDSVKYAKLQSLAMDYASAEYYGSHVKPIDYSPMNLYVGSKLTGSYLMCVSAIRGTASHEVRAYACQ